MLKETNNNKIIYKCKCLFGSRYTSYNIFIYKRNENKIISFLILLILQQSHRDNYIKPTEIIEKMKTWQHIKPYKLVLGQYYKPW